MESYHDILWIRICDMQKNYRTGKEGKKNKFWLRVWEGVLAVKVFGFWFQRLDEGQGLVGFALNFVSLKFYGNKFLIYKSLF